MTAPRRIDVVVVPTGTGNLASMLAALERVGARPRPASSPVEVEQAARLVVPGVGAFGAAKESLEASGFWEPIRAHVSAGKPSLVVCLGLQLLAETSEESPGVAGFGIVPGMVRRFSRELRVPQLGWNLVDATPSCRFVESGHAYFANGYSLRDAPGWNVAWSSYGGPFVAAMERGDVLACQFHPELSGDFGAALLRRWLLGTERVAGPMPRIIPCLDVRDGRIVKGVRFQNLRDAGDPAERAALYQQQGADELVVLDISATDEGRRTRVETVRAVRARIGIPLTVGGGVRAIDDVGRLLDAGADKVAMNTAAVGQPGILETVAQRFGRQCTILALDAARTEHGWEVVTHAGKNRTGLDAVAWAREATQRGAGELLVTSVDQDGTREGYDTELLRAIRAQVSVPVIASGGASCVQDLLEALEAGADAVLAASIFHDGDETVASVKAELAQRGARVRR